MLHPLHFRQSIIFLTEVNCLSLKGDVGAPEEQGISSASAVYPWQKIKAGKIKHFLISPENLSFTKLKIPPLEYLLFFLHSESVTTLLSQIPNTSHEVGGSDEGSDLNIKITKPQL